MKQEARSISSVDEIDFLRHAVIEASAGTGKTYTLEHLVVAMLETIVPIGRMKRRPGIGEILLVTFTEKAAAEIKERVRRRIDERLEKLEDKKGDRELVHHLQIQMENFDQARIFTIHGFCRNVLQQYAFENGETFDNGLTEDKSLVEKILNQVMRSHWPEEMGEKLPMLLELSGFTKMKSFKPMWRMEFYSLLGRFNQGRDILIPSLQPGPGGLCKAIDAIEGRLKDILIPIRKMAGPIDPADPEANRFYREYHSMIDNKVINGRSAKPRLERIFLPLLELLLQSEKSPADILVQCFTF